MFVGCSSLVGGNGSTYSNTDISATLGIRAQVDSIIPSNSGEMFESVPGYFTYTSLGKFPNRDSYVTVQYNNLSNQGEFKNQVPIYNYFSSKSGSPTFDTAFRAGSTYCGSNDPAIIPLPPKGIDSKAPFLGWSKTDGANEKEYDLAQRVYVNQDTIGEDGVVRLYAVWGSTEEKSEVHAAIENNTMTFFYGDGKFGGETIDVPLAYGGENSPFDKYKENVYNVVFDESFARCTNLQSTKNWFYGFANLQKISHTKYLNTSVVINMSGMFNGCSTLTSIDLDTASSSTTLDLTNFETRCVTNMSYMFNGVAAATVIDASSFVTGKNGGDFSNMFNNCTNLTTIMVSKDFVINDGGQSYTMFANDSNLVGGEGTE